jgi:cellulose synthase/poly-beta-1,6-N-acetylglucosamine synthase-like glycosyltransferase
MQSAVFSNSNLKHPDLLNVKSLRFAIFKHPSTQLYVKYGLYDTTVTKSFEKLNLINTYLYTYKFPSIMFVFIKSSMADTNIEVLIKTKSKKSLREILN